ncbi:NUDIX domain-containing protein [Pseudogemmobacter hezensis]|uniref:NUDIX domain-containing protein n=1 Tax=Pseudogemmobacter hezensis TaxID=2737662 RepID=UPI00345908D0
MDRSDLRDPRFVGCPDLATLVLGGDAEQLSPEGADRAQKRLIFWQQATGGLSAGDPALELQLARDIFSQQEAAPAARLFALRSPMLSAASARLRAARQSRRDNGPLAEPPRTEPPRNEQPHTEQTGTDQTGTEQPGDAPLVAAETLSWPHRGFFALAKTSLRHRRFSGGMSDLLQREVFVATDAVTVLPYDPALDLVLLVEQFRMGPYMRGEPRPWLIEAVAGRIDAGESPEEAARREAREEAGITLGEIFPVADYYPSPGAHSEYIWSSVALADLSAQTGGLYGLETEGEDIRTHVIPFAEAMAWMAAGRCANAPLILSLLWLQGERDRLRRQARESDAAGGAAGGAAGDATAGSAG